MTLSLHCYVFHCSHCCLSCGSESCPCCSRSSSRSKNKPGKVPRKIHKAEREKLKRDSLNVLFLKLSDTLGMLFLSNLPVTTQYLILMHPSKLIYNAWLWAIKQMVHNFLPSIYPEPAHQNNGKASVLSNATRILRDLLAQVDCLKKENTTLLSESHYVSFLKLILLFG